uniref:Uncharacterized protein n=1 Tax=Magallana gigas TaxID=29159 RepID=K1R1V8_MAGGI
MESSGFVGAHFCGSTFLTSLDQLILQIDNTNFMQSVDMEAICGIDDIFYGNFHINKTPCVTDNNSIALSL